MNIILYGCSGRMGQVVSKVVDQFPNCSIIYGVDRNAGRNKLVGQQNRHGYPVYASPEDSQETGDVIVDFSNHEAVGQILAFAQDKKIPVILAATGITHMEQMEINKAAKEIAIFQSPNFSLGINLMAACLEMMVPVLEKNFDMDIVEKHHKEKKDAPSGTALFLADIMEKSGTQPHNINVHALRAGTIPGEHTVIFAGPDEMIEIKHTALSREVFARGAIKAAEYIIGKSPGLYTMADLIGRNKI